MSCLITDAEIKELIEAANEIENDKTYVKSFQSEEDRMDEEFIKAENTPYVEREWTKEELKEIDKHLEYWNSLLNAA